MSISLSEYKKTKVPNIYVSKNHTNKFLFRKRSSDGKRATKVAEIAVREKWTGRELFARSYGGFCRMGKKAKIWRYLPLLGFSQISKLSSFGIYIWRPESKLKPLLG
ncbi:hypothetical protein [Campylobacter concisus]|jgi:hypothetical protein